MYRQESLICPFARSLGTSGVGHRDDEAEQDEAPEQRQAVPHRVE